MTAHRWLVVSLALGIAAAAFASCKGSTGSGAGPGGGGSGAGGAASTGSGGSGGATTGTGGAKGDGGPILCLAQYTNIPKNGPCDLLNQTCPPGWTCSPVPGGSATSCEPSFGLKTANEDCYATTECDAKLVCIGLTPTHPGKCLAFCCNDSSNAPCNGGYCNEQVDYGNGNYAYVCSYGQRCMLLTADACPVGFDCHVETAAGQGIAVCFEPSPTEVPELGTCHFINDCGNMQDCFGLPGNGGSVCLWYCALSGPSTSAAPGLGGCPSNETCESSYQGQPVDIGVDGVGLCIPNGGIMPPDAGSDAGDAGDGGDGGDASTGDGGDASTGDGGDAGTGDADIADADDSG